MNALHKDRLKRRAAVAAVAGLMIFSLFTAFVQPGTHVGRTGTLLASQAFAQEKPVAAAADLVEPHALTEDTTASQPIFRSDPLAALADSLKQKERELEQREKALKRKEEYLESIRKETAANLARIQELYDKLERKSAQAQQQREKDLAKWKSIYQSMPPEKAGPIIQQMETEFALALLSQMDPKKAAKIVSAIQPEKAVELTRQLGAKKP